MGVRVAAVCLSIALLGAVPAAATESEIEFKVIGVDPAGDAPDGMDLSYLSIGPSDEGLELRYGLDGPLTPEDIAFDGTLYWTFWVAPKGGGWAQVPSRYGTRRLKDRTYYTVHAEFAGRSGMYFGLDRWDRCTMCGDWGVDGHWELSGHYAPDGTYLAIRLPEWIAEPGGKVRSCTSHRTYCNYASNGDHVNLHAHLHATPVDVDEMAAREPYRVP